MKLFLLAILFASTYNCNSHSSAAPNTDSVSSNSIHDSSIIDGSANYINDTSLAGKWVLQPVMASDTATGKIPTIDFDLSTHRFHGNTGCNAMSGTFILQKDALSFSQNMITTKMACAGYNEKAFIDNLLKTNRYEIKNGVLQLMNNTTILSKWARHADTSSTKHI